MSEAYVITDLDGYAEQMREAAAKSIADDTKENLDEYINLTEVKEIVSSWCVGYDHEERPILDEDANQNIFEDIRIWITNIGLAKLAAKGFVECAWDDDVNEMVFWYNGEKNESTNN